MAHTAPRFLAAVLCMVLPMAACAEQSRPAAIEELNADTSMLLFSDDENLTAEKPYYKALLNKNDQCSREEVDIKIVSSEEEEMVEYLNVQSFPSLYVLEGTETKDQYNGPLESKDINTFINQYIDCG